MPLPLLIGGVAAAAVAWSAKKGYDGFQTKSEAEDIQENATERYERAKQCFEKQNKQTAESLAKLGELQLQIGKDFNAFKQIADELLNKIEQSQNKDLEISLPEYRLAKIVDLSLSATSYSAMLVGGGAAGAAASFAAYGGVMALAAASTGTPISALGGAAAYNATMAALGGGSLATGGLGMAGGAMVLGAAAIAPVLAVAGFVYNKHAEKAMENASEYAYEVHQAVKKMKLSFQYLSRTEQYVNNLAKELNRIYQVFRQYFDNLTAMNTLMKNGSINLDSVGDSILLSIDNGYQIAAILTDIITTPLFKVKKDSSGKVIMKGGVAEMELDGNDMQIINVEEMTKSVSMGSKEAIAKVIRTE